MGGIIAVIIVIVIIVKSVKAVKNTEQASSASGTARTAPAANAARPAQSSYRPAQSSYRPASGSCETNYPKQLTNAQIQALNIADYSHCSDFSFRELPEGADELTALIRHNRAHEKELERHMHSTQMEEYDFS